jgi:hypothetical protein
MTKLVDTASATNAAAQPAAAYADDKEAAVRGDGRHPDQRPAMLG